jgi:RimJ/RimL family protein N-acetyltransferase
LSPTGGVLVRERTDADLDDLFHLAAAVQEHDGYPGRRPRDLRAFLVSDDALGAWVAHFEGRLVGHVALHERSLPVVMRTAGEALGRADHELAVVARLIVDPAVRRCRAGSALLDAAATAARDLGRHPVLDVVTRYDAANALYRSAGWLNLGEVEMAFRDGMVLQSHVYAAPPQGVPASSRLSIDTGAPGVVLRELVSADLDAYYDLVDRNRGHLNQRGDHPFEAAATSEEISAYFEAPWDSNIRLGVRLDDRLVGRIDLVPIDPPRWVIGYWLDAGVTGRGIATAACRAAIGHARRLGAHEIYAGISDGNAPSIGVVQRLGFEHIQDVEGRSRWRLPLVEHPSPPAMA